MRQLVVRPRYLLSLEVNVCIEVEQASNKENGRCRWQLWEILECIPTFCSRMPRCGVAHGDLPAPRSSLQGLCGSQMFIGVLLFGVLCAMITSSVTFKVYPTILPERVLPPQKFVVPYKTKG